MFMYFGQVSAISDEFFPAAWKKFAYLNSVPCIVKFV